MPFTMNGIGTWYYGKANLFSYTDFCPQCNRYVTLSSYDTREWIVVFFIPVIPFGKKRIMDSCPVCTKHRQMPLQKFVQAKQAAYAAAEAKVLEAPDDADAAGQLLGAFAAYQDLDRFDEEAPQILQHFPDNPALLNTVGLIHYQFGRMDEARGCLEQSLLIVDDDEIRHVLGFIYARLSDPDTAAEYFRSIADQGIREKAGALFAVVDAYQAQGRHQDALTWLEHIVRLAPELGESKEYKKSRKLSEKHHLSGKPLKNKQFAPAGKEKTPLSGKKALGIAALAFLAIGLALAGTSLYRGRRADVFLVNGLGRPYEAVVAGRLYVLPESGYQKIAIPEGDIALEVRDADLDIAPSSVHLESSFWKRPFLKRVYVINPDAIALIEWNKVFYHQDIAKAPDPEWALYYGQQVHVFDGVHFAFESLPDEISMSHSGPESRVQVALFDKSRFSPEQMPDVIEEFFGVEAKIAYMKKILYYEPDNLIHLYALYSRTDAKTFIEAIRPGLEAVPLRMEWHRLYQTATDISAPAYDLAAEYKSRLEKTPNDAGLQYLYGRSLREDRLEARAWFERSIQNLRPSAYGYFALGFDAMVIADYPTALGYFENALRIDPTHFIFCACYYDMLIASNQLGQAEAYCAKQVSQNTRDYRWMPEYVSVLRQEGKNTEANEAFEHWCRRNQAFFSEEDFSYMRRMDRINAAYLAGDFQSLHAIIGEPNDIDDMLLLTLHDKKPISHDLLAQADSFSPTWLLLCYISESRLGHDGDAGVFLAEASKRLACGDYEERYVSRCLASAVEPDADTICALQIETEEKAVMLTALGVRYPVYRERFFALADRLNYKKAFPYHFLKSVHQDAGRQDSPLAPGIDKKSRLPG